MNSWMIWTLMSLKRQLKRPAFVLVLVLIPVMLLGIGKGTAQDSDKISIALFSVDESIGPEVMELLIGEEGIFSFYGSPSEEDLREDVAARRAECGYVFDSNLKERLDAGKAKRCITVVSAPSTVLAELSTEVVYARLIDVYGRGLLKEYSSSFSFLPEEERWKQLEPLYDRYLTDGSTFSFRYETADGGLTVSDGGQPEAPKVFPIRGMTAVMVFVIGLFSAAWLGRDEEQGLFVSIPEGKRTVIKAITAGAPVFLSGVSGLAALGISERGDRFWLELTLMALYVCLVTGVSMALQRLTVRPAVLLGVIPFFAMAALAVCPVFADLSPFVPAIRTVRWLFPPYYYLRICAVLF